MIVAKIFGHVPCGMVKEFSRCMMWLTAIGGVTWMRNTAVLWGVGIEAYTVLKFLWPILQSNFNRPYYDAYLSYKPRPNSEDKLYTCSHDWCVFSSVQVDAYWCHLLGVRSVTHLMIEAYRNKIYFSPTFLHHHINILRRE